VFRAFVLVCRRLGSCTGCGCVDHEWAESSPSASTARHDNFEVVRRLWISFRPGFFLPVCVFSRCLFSATSLCVRLLEPLFDAAGADRGEETKAASDPAAQTVLLETRHVKATLSAMTVKTDRKDEASVAARSFERERGFSTNRRRKRRCRLNPAASFLRDVASSCGGRSRYVPSRWGPAAWPAGR
jgi:hypothetical protein